jgi:5-methylcytosine-specific restriction endonuclease McrA
MSIIDSIEGMKTCPKCAVEKSFSDFQKNKARLDGVETYCRECNNARLREKYSKNPQKKIAKTREYHLANPEWSKETLRKWHVENRDRRYQKVKERLATDPNFVEYRREVQSRSERERRARIAKATVTKVTKKDYEDLLEKFNHACWICEQPLIKVVWDHVHPVAKGGDHSVDNLRPACEPCNTRKNSKWPFTEEMRQELSAEVRLINSRGGDA